MVRCAKAITGTMNFLDILRLLNFRHLPKTFLFQWDIWGLTAAFLKRATLSVLIWACPLDWKTNDKNLRMTPFCLDSVAMEILSIPFPFTCKLLASYEHAHSFSPFCPHSIVAFDREDSVNYNWITFLRIFVLKYLHIDKKIWLHYPSTLDFYPC